jgi:predicted RNase H-like HicB family nuclease
MTAMISKYVEQALTRAHYEHVDARTWSARVPQLRGVLALGATREACRAQLAEVVEEWVLVRVARRLPIPRLGGVTIRVRKAS